MKSLSKQKGYMGHLLAMAAAISQAAHINSAIFYLLEDVPHRGWKKIEDKIKQQNGLLKNNPVQHHSPNNSLNNTSINSPNLNQSSAPIFNRNSNLPQTSPKFFTFNVFKI